MKMNMVKAFGSWVTGLFFLVACFACAGTPGVKKEPPSPNEAAGKTQASQREEVKAPVEAAKPAAASEPAPQETLYVHTIKWSGESVSIIAAWYTGDLQNWKALAEVNPDINPNRVHEGMKIRIPERMMTTKAAMTKEHVDSFYAKAKKPPRRGTDAPPKDVEPELFGPKELPKK